MNNKWSLVVHDVGTDYANIWVGTLFPNERKSSRYSLHLFQKDALVKKIIIPKSGLKRPFPSLDQRFYKTLRVKDLPAGENFTVHFVRESENVDGQVLGEKILSRGSFRTLPKALNANDKPFVVALGSCYYSESDAGRTADSYTALLQAGEDRVKPDVKFLTGDQVYLDIGLDSLSPIECEITNRIADDYAIAWQSLRGMLRHGGTWMLADDHEYWNNYPNTSGTNPYLWMITGSDRVRKVWKDTAEDGIRNVQNISTSRQFSIGKDLSFFVADVRCHRTENEFMPAASFKKLIAWAETLNCPGVLTLAQPLMVKPGSSEDKNLANYTEQYLELLRALGSSGHDIVVLSGDVHFGRVGKVALGTNGATMYEIISSPMSNLTGLDGRIAADKAKKLPRFPAISVDGMDSQPVQYPQQWRVSSERIRSWFLLTNHTKTREHFFTLSFSKTPAGKIKLEVQAWQLRYRGRDGLPRKQFSNSHRFMLS